MPRQKTQPVQPNAATAQHLTTLDAATRVEGMIETAAEREHNEKRQMVIAQYGDGLPYIREHYIAESRRDTRHAAEAAIRVGRRLIVMKECEPHGSWLDCLREIGIEPATAQRMMAAARRIASLPNAATAQHLLDAAAGQSKLFELLSLPADQFEELAATGETGELHLDDVATMGVRELREAVREARADNEAKDARAGERERAIENLQKELRKTKGQLAKATPDELAADLRQKCSMAAMQVRVDLTSRNDDADSLLNRAQALIEHGEQHGVDHTQFLAGLFAELLTDVRMVRDELGLPIVDARS